eukprot:282566_1
MLNAKLFHQNDERCYKENETMNGISNCSYLTRIMHSLKYYQSLSSCKNTFIQFCMETYSKRCLDDYIHFICYHADEFNNIVNDLQTNYDLCKCNNINQCVWTQRHYENRNNNRIVKDDYNFFIQLFDTMHFYLFHLEDIALRVPISDITKQEQVDEDDDTELKLDNLQLLDLQIGKMQSIIESKKMKFNLCTDRLDKNNTKFNIMIETKEMKTENTFLDDMQIYIQDNSEKQHKQLLHNLMRNIKQQEYDTDSIKDDVYIYYDGNNQICNTFYYVNFNHHIIEYIKEFAKYYDVSSNAFSTGMTFWYHEYYKTIDDQRIKQQQIGSGTENDFDGESVVDLFVKNKFCSLKDEVLNCKFISICQLQNQVIDKGNRYIQTQKCKQIKCMHGAYDYNQYDKRYEDPLNYGIPYGAKLSASHLYALILYCDFTDFCTDFSSTFRKIKWNETTQSVKERNRKYYHISKHLREIIQYYGIKFSYSENGYEYGPFYTGMSFCM